MGNLDFSHFDFIDLCGMAWFVWVCYWYAVAWFVKATKSREGIVSRLTHTIPLGLGFCLIFHGSRSPILYGRLYDSQLVGLLGLLITIAGQAFAVWSRNHLGRNWSGIITLKEGHELIRSGPYRWFRHPLYVGFLTAALGSALAAGTGDAFLGFVTITVAIVFKLRREEALLTREFGDQYRQFQKEVPALVPFIY